MESDSREESAFSEKKTEKTKNTILDKCYSNSTSSILSNKSITIKKLNSFIDNHSKYIESLRDDIENSNVHLYELRKIIKENQLIINKVNTEIEHTENTIKQLEESIISNKEQLKKLEMEENSNKESTRRLHVEVECTTDEIERLQKEIEHHLEYVNELKENIENLRLVVIEQREKIAEAQESIDRNIQSIEDLEKEISNKKADVETNNREIAGIIAQMRELDTIIEESTVKKKMLNEEERKLYEELNELEKEKKKVEEAIQIKYKEEKDIIKDKESTSCELDNNVQSNGKSKTKIKEQQDNSQEKQIIEDTSSLSDEKCHIVKIQIEETITNNRSKKENSILNLFNSTSNYESNKESSTVTSIDNCKESMIGELQELQKEIEKDIESIKADIKEVQEAKNSYEEKEKESKFDKEKLQEIIQSLKEQNKNLIGEIEKESTDKTAKEEKHEKHKEKVEEAEKGQCLNMDIKDMIDEVEDNEKEAERLERQVEKLKQKVIGQNEEIAERLEKNKQVRESMAEERKEIQRLVKEEKTKEKEVKEKKHELEECECENKEKREEIRNTEKEAKEMEREIERRSREIERKEEEIKKISEINVKDEREDKVLEEENNKEDKVEVKEEEKDLNKEDLSNLHKNTLEKNLHKNRKEEIKELKRKPTENGLINKNAFSLQPLEISDRFVSCLETALLTNQVSFSVEDPQGKKTSFALQFYDDVSEISSTSNEIAVFELVDNQMQNGRFTVKHVEFIKVTEKENKMQNSAEDMKEPGSKQKTEGELENKKMGTDVEDLEIINMQQGKSKKEEEEVKCVSTGSKQVESTINSCECKTVKEGESTINSCECNEKRTAISSDENRQESTTTNKSSTICSVKEEPTKGINQEQSKKTFTNVFDRLSQNSPKLSQSNLSNISTSQKSKEGTEIDPLRDPQKIIEIQEKLVKEKEMEVPNDPASLYKVLDKQKCESNQESSIYAKSICSHPSCSSLTNKSTSKSSIAQKQSQLFKKDTICSQCSSQQSLERFEKLLSEEIGSLPQTEPVYNQKPTPLVPLEGLFQEVSSNDGSLVFIPMGSEQSITAQTSVKSNNSERTNVQLSKKSSQSSGIFITEKPTQRNVSNEQSTVSNKQIDSFVPPDTQKESTCPQNFMQSLQQQASQPSIPLPIIKCMKGDKNNNFVIHIAVPDDSDYEVVLHKNREESEVSNSRENLRNAADQRGVLPGVFGLSLQTPSEETPCQASSSNTASLAALRSLGREDPQTTQSTCSSNTSRFLSESESNTTSFYACCNRSTGGTAGVRLPFVGESTGNNAFERICSFCKKNIDSQVQIGEVNADSILDALNEQFETSSTALERNKEQQLVIDELTHVLNVPEEIKQEQVNEILNKLKSQASFVSTTSGAAQEKIEMSDAPKAGTVKHLIELFEKKIKKE